MLYEIVEKLEIDIRIEQYDIVELKKLVKINSKMTSSVFDFLLSGGADK